MKRHTKLMLLGGMTLLGCAPAFGQAATAGTAGTGAQGAAFIPDISGVWTKPYLGWELPLSGPGPVRNRSRSPNGSANFQKLDGDYTNPILNPRAAEEVKNNGEMELNGASAPNSRNQCWPEGLPFVFFDAGIAMLQQRDQITILYDYDHEVRRVRLNQPHPEHLAPSWYGDSVGHFEGDTLVIDTVGIKVGRFSRADPFGTPFTDALHVLERYRLIDYEAAIEAQKRGLKEWPRNQGGDLVIDPDYRGKGLQFQYTVEDEGVFKMPWSATVTYRRALGALSENVCAENMLGTYFGKVSAVPRADKPDF